MSEYEFERMELQALLEIYARQSKEFTSALNKGASWETLSEKRITIKLLSSQINRKYKEKYYSNNRRRDQAPHGD